MRVADNPWNQSLYKILITQLNEIVKMLCNAICLVSHIKFIFNKGRANELSLYEKKKLFCTKQFNYWKFFPLEDLNFCLRLQVSLKFCWKCFGRCVKKRFCTIQVCECVLSVCLCMWFINTYEYTGARTSTHFYVNEK